MAINNEPYNEKLSLLHLKKVASLASAAEDTYLNKNCGRRPLNFSYPVYRTFAGNNIPYVDYVTVRHRTSVIRSTQAN